MMVSHSFVLLTWLSQCVFTTIIIRWCLLYPFSLWCWCPFSFASLLFHFIYPTIQFDANFLLSNDKQDVYKASICLNFCTELSGSDKPNKPCHTIDFTYLVLVILYKKVLLLQLKVNYDYLLLPIYLVGLITPLYDPITLIFYASSMFR